MGFSILLALLSFNLLHAADAEQTINSFCRWHSVKEVRLRGSLAAIANNNSCHTDGEVYVCVGELQCDKDIKFKSASGQAMRVSRDYLNSAACAQKKKCGEVKPLDCLKDGLAEPTGTDLTANPSLVPPKETLLVPARE